MNSDEPFPDTPRLTGRTLTRRTWIGRSRGATKSFTKTVLRLYPAERLVLCSALLCGALYWWIGIPLRSPLTLYRNKVLFAWSTYGIALVVLVLLVRLQDISHSRRDKQSRSWMHTLQRYRGQYLQRENFVRSLRMLHAIGLMFAVYINLKHLIPFVHGRVYDSSLATFERYLFQGSSPTTVTQRLLGEASAEWLSVGYTLFYPYIAIVVLCIVLQHSTQRVYHYTLGFVLLWLSAIPIEYAIPTWGPCFSTPELVEHLPRTQVRELQSDLWRQKLYVDANPRSDIGVFLISGVPSLHFAVVLLGTVYLWVLNPLLGFFSLCFLAVTFISTLYFGWHFVVDLVAAVFLVFIVECIVRRMMRDSCLESRNIEND